MAHLGRASLHSRPVARFDALAQRAEDIDLRIFFRPRPDSGHTASRGTAGVQRSANTPVASLLAAQACWAVPRQHQRVEVEVLSPPQDASAARLRRSIGLTLLGGVTWLAAAALFRAATFNSSTKKRD